MSSKQLSTILGSAPSATAQGQALNPQINDETKVRLKPIEYTRIVASIPQTLKDEIRQYIKTNKGETETTVILRSLKKMGFSVDPSLIIDKRSAR